MRVWGVLMGTRGGKIHFAEIGRRGKEEEREIQRYGKVVNLNVFPPV